MAPLGNTQTAGLDGVPAPELAFFEGGELFAGEQSFRGLREVVDEILKAGFGDGGLLQFDEDQRLVIEGGRSLVAARLVSHTLPELLNCLLHCLRRPFRLPRVSLAAGEA